MIYLDPQQADVMIEKDDYTYHCYIGVGGAVDHETAKTEAKWAIMRSHREVSGTETKTIVLLAEGNDVFDKVLDDYESYNYTHPQ